MKDHQTGRSAGYGFITVSSHCTVLNVVYLISVY